MASTISRRTMIRATGTAGLAALLAACGDPADTASPTEPGTDASPSELPNTDDIAQQAFEAAGLTGPSTLVPIVATSEVLTGADGRIPFGVLGPDQRPILDADVQVWLVVEGEVVAGPIEPIFYGEGLGDRGIYIASVELDSVGLHELVVQVDGDAVGQTAVSVVDPASSTTFPPGATFPVLTTPTVADPGKLEKLCTQVPPCSMHDVSLDEAMAAGPVVFTVATPQFCQTAVCGPVVSVIDELRERLGRDDITFIHAEVYNDAGNTVSDVVTELGLPTEPWTWVIDADGIVVDRFDGPVVPSLLEPTVAAL